MNRQAILCITLAVPMLALLVPALPAQAPDEAILLRGSVHEVPAPLEGTLDWSDPEALHFRSDGQDYQISSESIVGYKWGKRSSGASQGLGDAAHKLGRTILPMVSGGKKYLTIDFDSKDGERQYVVFGIPKRTVSDADETLSAWVARSNELAATVDDGKWWGDRYWKTSRSAERWEKNKQEAATGQRGEVATRDE